jgi:hypothetical protein
MSNVSEISSITEKGTVTGTRTGDSFNTQPFEIIIEKPKELIDIDGKQNANINLVKFDESKNNVIIIDKVNPHSILENKVFSYTNNNISQTQNNKNNDVQNQEEQQSLLTPLEKDLNEIKSFVQDSMKDEMKTVSIHIQQNFSSKYMIAHQREEIIKTMDFEETIPILIEQHILKWNRDRENCLKWIQKQYQLFHFLAGDRNKFMKLGIFTLILMIMFATVFSILFITNVLKDLTIYLIILSIFTSILMAITIYCFRIHCKHFGGVTLHLLPCSKYAQYILANYRFDSQEIRERLIKIAKYTGNGGDDIDSDQIITNLFNCYKELERILIHFKDKQLSINYYNGVPNDIEIKLIANWFTDHLRNPDNLEKLPLTILINWKYIKNYLKVKKQYRREQKKQKQQNLKFNNQQANKKKSTYIHPCCCSCYYDSYSCSRNRCCTCLIWMWKIACGYDDDDSSDNDNDVDSDKDKNHIIKSKTQVMFEMMNHDIGKRGKYFCDQLLRYRSKNIPQLRQIQTNISNPQLDLIYSSPPSTTKHNNFLDNIKKQKQMQMETGGVGTLMSSSSITTNTTPVGTSSFSNLDPQNYHSRQKTKSSVQSFLTINNVNENELTNIIQPYNKNSLSVYWFGDAMRMLSNKEIFFGEPANKIEISENIQNGNIDVIYEKPNFLVNNDYNSNQNDSDPLFLFSSDA